MSFKIGDRVRIAAAGLYMDDYGVFARNNVGNATGTVVHVEGGNAPWPFQVSVDGWYSPRTDHTILLTTKEIEKID